MGVTFSASSLLCPGPRHPSLSVQRSLVRLSYSQSCPAAPPVQSSIPGPFSSCASSSVPSGPCSHCLRICPGCARRGSSQEPLPYLFNTSMRSKETAAIKALGNRGSLCSGQTPCPRGSTLGTALLDLRGVRNPEGHTANTSPRIRATSPAENKPPFVPVIKLGKA